MEKITEKNAYDPAKVVLDYSTDSSRRKLRQPFPLSWPEPPTSGVDRLINTILDVVGATGACIVLYGVTVIMFGLF